VTPVSAVEFLVWLLLAAASIALIAERLRIPYTVALVLGGLLLGTAKVPFLSPLQPGHRPDWLTPDVILILFLPALVFEGSVKFDVRELLRNLAPLLLLANAGVLIAALVTGGVVAWCGGLPLPAALLFGAIIAATDPISVLALFKDLQVDPRLSLLVEAESLLNDGTAVVLFGILAAGLGGTLDLAAGAVQFVLAVAGGALLGAALGFLASRVTRSVDDPQIEITLTTILAYGSYLAAQHLHLSGVIATAAAGLTLGAHVGPAGTAAEDRAPGARTVMSDRTRTAMQSFWEYISFVMNSLVFLLIGLEVHPQALWAHRRAVLVAVAAVLLGRALSVYLLVPLSNLRGEKIPLRWQHAAVWGGLRGALALALALSLSPANPYREEILSLTFGVVMVSILVQGLTVKPLLRLLGLAAGKQVQ
jgi:CPA1 family monovalent cation:H+ antiporter